MAIAQAQPAINTLLKIGNQGSPQIFNTLANVSDITGPQFSGAVVDVTSHSTGAPWRQKVVTLLDNGNITLPLFFIPSSPGSDGVPNTPFGHNGTTGLLSIFTNRSGFNGTIPREYLLQFPDPAATTWYFAAFVSTFSITAPVADVLRAAVTFVTTGEPILV